MHELSVAQALLDQIDAITAERAATCAVVVTIRVGPLSGVEPALLDRAFAVARLRDPRTATATLSIEPAEIRVACRDCGRDGAAHTGKLACSACGSRATRLLQGDELLLLRVELEIAADAAPQLNQSEGVCHV
ncbi:MAG: hydrogenase maturation nickel metallochaperone HypA [Nevskia sp.]|nr:hydrogenase maturation nickel metallochaperone HypA [Nevskia sp.]